MQELDEQTLKIVTETLSRDFQGYGKLELIFDGEFYVGNRKLCNGLKAFVTGYQLAILRDHFTDEILIGKIMKFLEY